MTEEELNDSTPSLTAPSDSPAFGVAVHELYLSGTTRETIMRLTGCTRNAIRNALGVAIAKRLVAGGFNAGYPPDPPVPRVWSQYENNLVAARKDLDDPSLLASFLYRPLTDVVEKIRKLTYLESRSVAPHETAPKPVTNRELQHRLDSKTNEVCTIDGVDFVLVSRNGVLEMWKGGERTHQEAIAAVRAEIPRLPDKLDMMERSWKLAPKGTKTRAPEEET